MATSQTRRIFPDHVRYFGTGMESFPVPDLTKIQTASYERFLQYQYPEDQRENLPDEVKLNEYRIPPDKRENIGLEAVLRETFPITGQDGKVSLEYVSYELDKPRFEPDECRRLRLTYGRPFRIRLRLNREQPIEQDVYLGDLPIMLGGGEFIINGAERVVVSQLHRSPGVDFVSEEEESGDSRAFSCRIIPERGSWIEFNISRKESISVRIDQTPKFSPIMLLRAMDPKYSETAAILRAFFKTEVVSLKGKSVNIEGKIAVDNVIYPVGSPNCGEIIVESGQKITNNQAEQIRKSGLKEVEVMQADNKNTLFMNTLAEDPSQSYEEALLRIYQRMRPGNPPQLDKAKKLFEEKFFDVNRYRLGRVGRFRMNRKFGMNISEDILTLLPEDLICAIKAILGLYVGDPNYHVDDIDHLGNRRLRTIDELAADEIRKGFAKLRRTVIDRMGNSNKDINEMEPRTLITPKSVSGAVDFFFGRGELSQVVDQTNPLSMLTHERRLSALGPGGLNRKRAGFDVRDVHSSHYGRICPIETPEGTNIGLISSLGIYAGVDEYGFLITPFQVVDKGRLTGEIRWLRADEEGDAIFAPVDITIQKKEDGFSYIVGDPRAVGANVIARRKGEYEVVPVTKVNYIDVSACQMVGVSAGLIPFLEHDDANRALMGSNMQRQAVPLLVSETPLVGTGMERNCALNSSLLVRAKRGGTVTYCDARRIEIGDDIYILRKFKGMNERTCQNQKPIVTPGKVVKAGDVIADGAATHDGNLALGRNVLVAFMVWEGYNFEDAIILSEELVQNDVYTSIHIEEYDTEIRETKLGREEFTRDIPNVPERQLRNLDENGIIHIGTYVKPGDILVGKITPKSKTELTPEERLLHTIFGRAGEDVKNDSLEVPSGVEGIVIDTQYYSRSNVLTERESQLYEIQYKETEQKYSEAVARIFGNMIAKIEEVVGSPVLDRDGNPIVESKSYMQIVTEARNFNYTQFLSLPGKKRQEALTVLLEYRPRVEEALETLDQKVNTMKIGEQLRPGVLRMAKVYIATKRVISVGDKMAGRHGNKGVISKIMPREDMPFLADGTPIQILLNPLGVPSRMNVGQIMETHLGWAGATSGFRSITPVFNGAKEEDIKEACRVAGLPPHGKTRLFDGRTGEPFEQETTVGYIYMLKLHHLVDDKVHARSTGPYSMITQQPLGGKARFGGQRFGEMEVWALEAYGAAYILQELLTVKSDDVEGRTKIYESMVKGENRLEAGTPASFDVLTNEIRGLGLNMQLERGNNILN